VGIQKVDDEGESRKGSFVRTNNHIHTVLYCTVRSGYLKIATEQRHENDLEQYTRLYKLQYSTVVIKNSDTVCERMYCMIRHVYSCSTVLYNISLVTSLANSPCTFLLPQAAHKPATTRETRMKNRFWMLFLLYCQPRVLSASLHSQKSERERFNKIHYRSTFYLNKNRQAS
jgi:hypothetical protein